MNEKAKKLSKKNIIVDGHIDLPFRLYKENLLEEENINLNKNIIIWANIFPKIKVALLGKINVGIAIIKTNIKVK